MKTCPHCERVNEDDAKFCDSCGARLETKPEQTAMKAPSSEPTKAANTGESVLIENDTRFNKKQLSQFFRPTLVFAIAFFVLGVALILESIFLSDGDFIIMIAGALFIVGGACFAFTYHKSVNNPMFEEGKHQLYQFREDGLYARYFDGDKEISTGLVPYAFFTKILRGKDLLLLYYQQNRLVYLVNTHGFTKGDEAELRRLLKQRCTPQATKKI